MLAQRARPQGLRRLGRERGCGSCSAAVRSAAAASKTTETKGEALLRSSVSASSNERSYVSA
jgi:hypothetical protein